MINLEIITIREFRDLIKRRKSGESFDENVNIFIDSYINETEKRIHPLEKITDCMQLFYKSIEHFTDAAKAIYSESDTCISSDGWHMFNEVPIKTDLVKIEQSVIDSIPIYEKKLDEKELKIYKEAIHNYKLGYYYSASCTIWTMIDSCLFDSNIFMGGLNKKKDKFLSEVRLPEIVIQRLRQDLENKSFLTKSGSPDTQDSVNRHKLLHGNSIKEDVNACSFLKVLSMFFFVIDCRNRYDTLFE